MDFQASSLQKKIYLAEFGGNSSQNKQTSYPNSKTVSAYKLGFDKTGLEVDI